MTDLQTIADRVEIEALRGEFTDAAMMGDHERFVALFTEDGVYRIPDAGVVQSGRDELLAGTDKLAGAWEYFVQTTHPGVIELDGDVATGRTYVSEIGRQENGMSMLNYAIFHDRYRRTPEGWKFAERVFEVRYFDSSPLAGSAKVSWPPAAE
ncbi:nuclear transport factor 2 family protein [Kribbella sp. NBC_00709]|uniref:nuclear transport factor 2 family protein n=1 Tax=Kribbella sp. NBC_00709 TaxID=2975972 RepID=UPI002E28235F|nr:nuclear transport factor 2 family protein [Kribbella sp. NBC_00709]